MGIFRNRAIKGGGIFTSLNRIIQQGDHIMSHPDNISRGLYPGATPFGSFGERTTIAGETNVPVWPNGITISLPPVTGLQISIVSTSADDTALGTNIRVVEMHYLDINLDPQEEYITLNGLTPVLSVATDVRFIQALHLAEAGTILFAAGTITASETGTVYNEIEIGEIRSSSSFRMVPNGVKLYLRGAVGSSISGTAAAGTRLRLVASELDTHQYIDPFILVPFATIGLQDGSIGYTFPIPLPFITGTVVGAIHSSDKACTVSASWFGTLEPIAGP